MPILAQVFWLIGTLPWNKSRRPAVRRYAWWQCVPRRQPLPGGTVRGDVGATQRRALFVFFLYLFFAQICLDGRTYISILVIYGEPKLPDAPCSDQIADARIIISIGMSALARIKMHVIANFACFFFHRPRVFAVGGFPCEGHSPNGKAHSESVVCDRRSRYQWLRQQQVLLGCVLGVLLISIE